MFVETLEAQGWLELFTDPKRGCLVPVSSDGFDVYVREDKSILGEERLLALTQRRA